jgi:glycosyltransferase involved in cell wall biosynthesis
MNKKSNKNIFIANFIEEARLGGPQMRMALIASSFNKMLFNKKIDLTLIFPKDESKDFQNKCHLMNIKYHLFPTSKISRNFFNIIKYLVLFPYEIIILAMFLKKKSFDIVHISGGCFHLKGVIAAKIAGIKVLWELNDTYAPLFMRIIFFFISYFADYLVFASYRTRKYYGKFNLFKKKSFVIQSPVDTNFYDPSFSYPNEKYIEKLVKEKKIIIGTVANVSPVKGFETLIKTAKKLSSYSDKIVFLVVGAIHKSQRKYYNNLLTIIKKEKIKNFFFLGPRNDTRHIVNSMNIYICCSNNESSPLSLWEAMSMKKTIISTNVGDVHEFISNNVSGYIVDTNNENALTNKLKRLINDPILRRKFGNKVRNIAKSQFDLKLCRNLHFKMYQSIMGYYQLD